MGPRQVPLELPAGLAFIVAVVLLDLAIYFQHVVFHAVPALWRLHRVHHADLDFDVTTATRFHPVEIVLSMRHQGRRRRSDRRCRRSGAVFEVLLNATAMFNHGNVGFPARVDRIAALVLVTPDMHRVHHSIDHDETNSNFGFNLPWWDRLFGTYRAAPSMSHETMTLGVDAFPNPGT